MGGGDGTAMGGSEGEKTGGGRDGDDRRRRCYDGDRTRRGIGTKWPHYHGAAKVRMRSERTYDRGRGGTMSVAGGVYGRSSDVEYIV